MSQGSDIAIVGMACVFPKAPDVGAFWENILGKVDAMTEAVPEWDGPFTRDSASIVKGIYTRRGGFLGDLARFDPLAHGVIPRAIDGAEPEHFIALRVAHDALADAGYVDRPFNRERTGVILGRGTYWNRGTGTLSQHMAVEQTVHLLAKLHPEHSAAELAALKEELRAGLPPFNADTAPGLVPSIMCGRIANRLDLMGPAYAVDAACASSLIAIEHAVGELSSGRADMILAGGIHVSTTPPIMLVFCELGALSRQGQVRSFSPEADGTLMGEGAGVVVLKRREDAERDGDRIYAVVKAVGVASDGRAMGLLAPRVEGEELAMRRAYEQAELAPRTVSLLDGHGTGTPIGDAVEIEALCRVFGPRDGDEPWCALGSVKSMIGHPIPAAGVAGIIKTALALHHKVLPPTLHAGAGNRKLASSPFYLNTETRPWVHADSDPRRAAVSAFGFGGINAHAILEEHRGAQPRERWTSVPSGRAHAPRHLDSEVVVLAAPSRAELLRRGAELRAAIAEQPGYALVDLAYTLNCPTGTGTARLAIVAASVGDLDRKLAGALGQLADPGCERIEDRGGVYYTDRPLYAPGALAFLFPGQGAQYPNMLADLCVHFPEVRSWFDLTDEAFVRHDRANLPSRAVFPLPNGASAAEAGALWAMDVGLATVAAANQALYSLLSRLEIQPAAVLGHSIGDSCALWAAGVVRMDGADLVTQSLLANSLYEQLREEGRLPTGALLAVAPTDPEQVVALVARVPDLFMAMDNCPRQIVVGGSAEAVATAAGELGRAGVTCMPLPFDYPYHTPYFVAYTERLAELYGERDGQVSLAPPSIPMYSCTIAARCPDDPDAIAELVTGQWSQPVRFRETIEAMHRDGVRIFVEVGPRGGLTPFVDDTLSGVAHLAVPADVTDRTGTAQLAHLVAQLAAHHVPMDLEFLYARRSPTRLRTPEGWVPAEPSADDRSVPLEVHLPTLVLDRVGPAPSSRGPDASTASSPKSPAPAGGPAPVATTVPTASGDHVLDAYLATMDRFLDVQRTMMQSALALAAAPAVAERRFPLLGSVVSRTEGELVALRRIDLDEDLFLHDHAFGGTRVSIVDETLLALPVVPMTVSMEMCAEAALALCPGRVVAGMEAIRAYQWIDLEDGHATLRITAQRQDAAGGVRVKVEVARLTEGTETGVRVAEGTVVLAEAYPAAEAAAPLELHGERGYPYGPEDLYAGRMFHGPRFQGVSSLDRWGERGTEATLRILPTADLFASTTDPDLVVDPQLLDAAGQIVGFWADEEHDYAALPFALEGLQRFADSPPPGTQVMGQARVRLLTDQQIRSDIDLIGPDGLLLARLTGWTNLCFPFSKPFNRPWASPRDATMGTPWPAMPDGAAVPPGFVARRMDLPPTLMGAGAAMLRRVVAKLLLNRRERAIWADLPGSDRDRFNWLLQQAAAKECVRTFLEATHGIELYPADIEVIPGEHGGPAVTIPWARQLGRLPFVSVAHSDGTVVAIAGDDGSCRGVGIALQRLGSLGSVAHPGAGERDLLAAFHGPARQEWALRVSAALEAAAKATGVGLEDPAGLAAQSLDAASGAVHVATGGAQILTVRTSRDGDWVAAVATS